MVKKAQVVQMPQRCCIPGCLEFPVLKGFCQLHYLKHAYSTLKLLKERNEVPELTGTEDEVFQIAQMTQKKARKTTS